MAKKKKDESGLFASLSSIGLGVVVFSMMGQVWGLGLCAVGGIGMFMEFYKSMGNKFNMLLDKCGLCIKNKGEDTIFPTVISKRTRDYGYDIELALLPGLCLSDFKQCREEFEQFFNAEVDFKYNNKRIFIQVKEGKLLSKYDFVPMVTEKVTEFPFAHSRDGLETLALNDNNPHLLVAGETGGGKSALLRLIITFFITTKKVSELALHLIDLKRGVEFEMFRNCAMVKGWGSNVGEAMGVLTKLINEMNRRYDVLRENGCVNIEEYNDMHKKNKWNYEILIVDEFANVTVNKDLLALVDKLLREARAVGIHIILCTQRPSATILPGDLKANLPAVIGLRCKNAVNSRIILDNDKASEIEVQGRAILQCNGAEKEVQIIFIDSKKAREMIKPFTVKKKTEVVDTSGEVKVNDNRQGFRDNFLD